MILLAIDPGSTHSALVTFNHASEVVESGYMENGDLLELLPDYADHLAIETLYCRAGQFIQNSHLETQLWAGRFIQAFGGPFTQVRRERVKGHFGASGCSNPDGVLRESLIGRFGGEGVAIGGKRCPKCNGKGWRGRDHATCEACTDGLLSPRGPFHNWTGSDRWSALAIACWWFDTQKVPAGETT